MPASPLPLNEPERLQALCSYGVLDTEPEPAFDDLTALAAELCDAPMSMISLVDTDRQWFKSRVGLDVTQTPRDQAFCAYALHSDEPLVVEDATRDPRFADNPMVTGAMHLRFYAGVPLINEDGLTLGTLCVMGTQPRTLSDHQRTALGRLGRQAVALLELRRTAARMTEAREKADGANRAKDAFIAMVSHEFRTPLHGILSFANFGLKNVETATPDKLNGYFTRIASSGQRLLHIVNDLLDLSKLEAGEMSYVFKREPLGPMIGATVDECQSLAAERGLRVTVTQPDASLFVEADRGRLMQAVRNLLGNALKFTPDGGCIELCVTAGGDGGHADHRDRQRAGHPRGGAGGRVRSVRSGELDAGGRRRDGAGPSDLRADRAGASREGVGGKRRAGRGPVHHRARPGRYQL